MSTPALSIVPELRRWVEAHLELACTPAELAKILLAQGIAADYASAVLAAVASDAARRITFADTPMLQAPDRNVPVLARIATPRIAVLGAVMSAAECEALIALARPRLAPSTVIDPASGQDVMATYRGSEGMFFRLHQTPLVSTLNTRMAALLNLPVENAEGLQVLRYPVGAESAPHFDFLPPINDANRASIRRSGQRLATLIVYLNNVEAGGETVFPTLGLSVIPQQGHGLCFEYRNADGALDARSLHAGAPVQKGEKWIVTQWMRSQRFVPRGSV
jgi:prolyl 4-hydroxylase